jgi:uncharacterized protein YukE
MSAPVPYTCPTIDGVIKTLKDAESDIDNLLYFSETTTPADFKNGIKEAISNLNSLWNGRYTDLEEIRSANEKLREWGSDLESKVEELESTIADLEYQLKNQSNAA